jgi:phosphopentomutase
MKRVILLIFDGVGCGELPDAGEYGDKGSNTLANIAREVGGLKLPNLRELGLGNIIPIKGISPVPSPSASFGKAAEVSPGKDSTSGHWELMGITLKDPFPVYPEGFPATMLKKFQDAVKRPVLGGWPASGTQIIQELGQEHIKTGCPIVYTSADSVFQIAAHKSVIPLPELYRMCELARKTFPGIGRIIARPFIGEKEKGFERTPERRDYSLPPPDVTLLDMLTTEKIPVTTIGKVDYLFAGRGITHAIHTTDNKDVMKKTLDVVTFARQGLVFANLVDFDMLWGHRNDVEGFARGLQEADKWLPDLLSALKQDDILFITADHGTDPTTPSTDHSREHIPVLVYGKDLLSGVNLGLRESFADIGATIGEHFDIRTKAGKSFLTQVLRR